MSKTFCAYPWEHLYVQTSGHQKICCLSDEHITKDDGYHQYNLSKDSLFSSWNSEYMKTIRKKMLNNEKSSVCKRCYDLEDKGIKSMRNPNGEEYYKSKTVDGIPENLPRNIELHFGNVCNLSCKMCSQMFSHSIGKELLKMGEQDPDFLKWVKKESGVVNNWTGELDVVYDWFKNDKVKKETFEFISKNVHNLTIVGGEPTAIKEFYELLNYCYDQNTLKNKSITLTTNLTNTNKNLTKWLYRIKNLVIYGSIDGLQKRNEYIRFPSKWENIMESLLFYKDLVKKNNSGKIVFGPAIQLLNIDQLADMVIFFENFAEEHKVNSDIWWTGVVTAPVICDYNIAPSEYKKYVSDVLTRKLNQIAHEENREQVIAHIDNLKKAPRTLNNKHILEAFVKYNDFQDKFRNGDSWRVLLPELEKSISPHATGIKTIF